MPFSVHSVRMAKWVVGHDAGAPHLASAESATCSCTCGDVSSLVDSRGLSTWTEEEEIAAQQLVLLQKLHSHFGRSGRHHFVQSTESADNFEVFKPPSHTASPCNSVESTCASNSIEIQHHPPLKRLSDTRDRKAPFAQQGWSRHSADQQLLGTRHVWGAKRGLPSRSTRPQRYRLLTELYEGTIPAA